MGLSLSALRNPAVTPMKTHRDPPETQSRHESLTRRIGNTPVWRTSPGRKTAGGQVNFRMSAPAMALMAEALDLWGVDQTTLMTTAFLEFCERYEVQGKSHD